MCTSKTFADLFRIKNKANLWNITGIIVRIIDPEKAPKQSTLAFSAVCMRINHKFVVKKLIKLVSRLINGQFQFANFIILISLQKLLMLKNRITES
ncbi:hypothetical protein BpHYR1_016569 [Brachionus plicatilis]|uniref:Uncharacterized protein n=1 Tax=Brachionus plicatilis TaxID=10195 RepID=A0A3M7QML1_BRAPC|nr:hypothetical protein BpHYR1_016569 [Brachionus plicatilis]